VLLRFEGDADAGRLRDALQKLHDAHGALRQRFESAPSGWRGTFAPVGEAVAFAVEDLRGEPDPLAAMKQLSEREQTAFRLDNGSLFRAALYRMAGGDRLLLVAHHLLVDGVTWQILLEDLALLLGGKALLEPTDSFAAWSSALREHSTSARVLAELPYWQGMDASGAGGGNPSGLPVENGRYADAAEELLEWSAADTAGLLRRAPSAYQTNAGELLLTAVARALGEWTGEPRVQIALEGHGRDAIAGVDVSRTAGWFTALYPFMLDLEDRPIGRRIRQMKEDLRQVPHGGAGYGMLRYLSGTPEGARLQARPRVSFNYLGEFRTGTTHSSLKPQASSPGSVSFSLCSDPIAPAVSPAGPRPFALEIAAIVVEDRLRLSVSYAAPHLAAARVRELCRAIDAELRLVVEHCSTRDATELTPADFTHKGITLDELDELFDDD
jgi:non-ribosomal peptide synthase protein (TIGR01720 family)